MSEETLVEQLRKAKRCDIRADLVGIKCDEYVYDALCNECNLAVSNAIADRIEAGYTPNSEVESDYIKRPKDSKGNNCLYGDMIRGIDNGRQGRIMSVSLCKDNKSWLFYVDEGDGNWEENAWSYLNVERIEPPKQLTKEDIDAMAKMDTSEYWNCTWNCIQWDSYKVSCPSKIEGEYPSIHYGVETCSQAQTIDILHKERERVAGEQ